MSSRADKNKGVESGLLLIRYVQRFSWVLLAAMAIGSWYAFGRDVAQSVFIGGVMANFSFFLLGRDVRLFLDNFGIVGRDWQAVQRVEKLRFFMKFYARLFVLGLLFYLLFTLLPIDVIGLAIGLSTVMLSVVVVVMSKGKHLYTA